MAGPQSHPRTVFLYGLHIHKKRIVFIFFIKIFVRRRGSSQVQFSLLYICRFWNKYLTWWLKTQFKEVIDNNKYLVWIRSFLCSETIRICTDMIETSSGLDPYLVRMLGQEMDSDQTMQNKKRIEMKWESIPSIPGHL